MVNLLQICMALNSYKYSHIMGLASHFYAHILACHHIISQIPEKSMKTLELIHKNFLNRWSAPVCFLLW